jgi:hypothetical protein
MGAQGIDPDGTARRAIGAPFCFSFGRPYDKFDRPIVGVPWQEFAGLLARHLCSAMRAGSRYSAIRKFVRGFRRVISIIGN